jgi:hypothetical protein
MRDIADAKRRSDRRRRPRIPHSDARRIFRRALLPVRT